MKKALITGIAGQDGAYLSKKGYEVHGIKRRSSSFNTQRIDHLYQELHIENRRFVLHYGDLTDTSNLIHIIKKTMPDEIYNLGAQSHVQVSFGRFNFGGEQQTTNTGRGEIINDFITGWQSEARKILFEKNKRLE